MIDFADLVKQALAASVLFLVIGLGMRATLADATSLFRETFQPPYSLLRAVLAMNFVVPIVAASIAAVFDLHPPVKVAIVAMSISPVPPVLPGKQLKFGGRHSYVYGLLVAVSFAAIIFVPLSVEMLGRLLDRDIHMSFVTMAMLVGRTILLPLGAGIAIRMLAPGVAERTAPWILVLGNVLLVVAILPVLIMSLRGMWSLIGNGTIVSILAVVLVAMAAGHRIGGPDRSDRTALAIVSAMRHPGVALAIARTNFPDDKLVPAAILLFALVALITTTVYGKRRLRGGSEAAGIAAHAGN